MTFKYNEIRQQLLIIYHSNQKINKRSLREIIKTYKIHYLIMIGAFILLNISCFIFSFIKDSSVWILLWIFIIMTILGFVLSYTPIPKMIKTEYHTINVTGRINIYNDLLANIIKCLNVNQALTIESLNDLQKEGNEYIKQTDSNFLAMIQGKAFDLLLVIPFTAIIGVIIQPEEKSNIIMCAYLILLSWAVFPLLRIIAAGWKKFKRVDEDEIVVQYLQEAKYALYFSKQKNEDKKCPTVHSL